MGFLWHCGELAGNGKLHSQPTSIEGACYAVIGAMILLCVLLAARSRELQDFAADELHIDAFRIGASIYVGTYLLGSSFGYRLMFLLFTIPQLTPMAKQFRFPAAARRLYHRCVCPLLSVVNVLLAVPACGMGAVTH